MKKVGDLGRRVHTGRDDASPSKQAGVSCSGAQEGKHDEDGRNRGSVAGGR